jgi:hypothetical protein
MRSAAGPETTGTAKKLQSCKPRIRGQIYPGIRFGKIRIRPENVLTEVRFVHDVVEKE